MKKIKIILLLALGLILLVGCSSNNEDEEIKEKTVTEIEYINTKSIDILNNLNNISFKNYKITLEKVTLSEENETSESGDEAQKSSESQQDSQSGENADSNKEELTITSIEEDNILSSDRNDIDWETIKTDIELINNAWSVILLDLYSLNSSSDIISDFSSTLNECTVSIKKEDKKQSLTNVAKLYSFVPQFLQEINGDKSKQIIKQTQSYLINAYALVDDNLLDTGIKNNITNAKNEFVKLLDDKEYVESKSYKTNKIYVLIDELETSLNANDTDVFFIKYKLLMETINTL